MFSQAPRRTPDIIRFLAAIPGHACVATMQMKVTLPPVTNVITLHYLSREVSAGVEPPPASSLSLFFFFCFLKAFTCLN